MKNHVKRTLQVASAGVILSALIAGCSGGGAEQVESQYTGEIPTDYEGSITVLLEEVNDAVIVESMLADFNAVYPNIDVTIDAMVYDQMRDKFITSVQSPEATYDVISLDSPWFTDFANAGFILPLDDRIADTPDFNNEDFFPSLTEMTVVEDQQYGIPHRQYGVGFLYRQDVFDEAGLEVPADLDELVATAQTLTTDEHAGIALQPQRGYKIMEEWIGWLFAAGGSVYDENGNANLDTPEAAYALEKYIEAFETAAPANSLNWAFDEAQRSLAGGQAVSMVSYNESFPVIADPEGLAGDLAETFSFAPMIGGKSVMGSFSLGIPTNSGDPDAAWAFISWLTSTDSEAARVIAGGSPVRQSALANPEVLENGFGEEFLLAVNDLIANSGPIASGANAEEMIQAVGTELNEAVAGTKSVEDALSDANEQIKQIQGIE